VVELDHLRGVEKRSRKLREAHHQHGADGEVGCDHGVGAGVGEALTKCVELFGRESGGAHDRVHRVVGTPFEVVPGRVEDREVDRHLGVGVAQCLWRCRHLEARAVEAHLVEVDTRVMRVDGGDELELGIVDDGLTHVLAHSPTGAQNANPDHEERVSRRSPAGE
jgi:hypothetical protein